jgi:glycerol 2-dehydrogenase (NADP+)
MVYTTLCRACLATDFCTGREIPAVGLGTWQGRYGAADDQKLKDSLIHALHYGYRMIDTAQYYGVEGIIGDAIRSSGVPREDITVMTKFWCHRNHEPDKALEDSLRATKLDYIDILMMHWPTTMNPDETPTAYPGSPSYVESWKLMEKLVGPTCRSVGVSNFTEKLLGELLKEASLIPSVNEIELHAQNPNLKLVPYCQSKGIQVISWRSVLPLFPLGCTC